MLVFILNSYKLNEARIPLLRLSFRQFCRVHCILCSVFVTREHNCIQFIRNFYSFRWSTFIVIIIFITVHFAQYATAIYILLIKLWDVSLDLLHYANNFVEVMRIPASPTRHCTYALGKRLALRIKCSSFFKLFMASLVLSMFSGFVCN